MSSIYDDMTDSEKEVAAYLGELGLYWIYESPVFVCDDKGRPRLWTPDFYIPRLGIYIEVWGSKDRDYDFRRRVYKLSDVPVIFIHSYKESEKWKGYLKKEIVKIHKKREEEIERMFNIPDYT